MNADHPGADALGHDRTRQHLPAPVPHAHHVAGNNPARLRILGMQGDGFTPGHRVPLAQFAVAQLAMQTVRRMRRQHLQLSGLGVAVPLHWRKPHRVRRTIRIAVAGNAF